jgi:SAF domain
MAATARAPQALEGHGPAGVPLRVRRRSGPLAAAGVLLVAGCALAFALTWLRAGDRTPVLAVSRTVAAGQVITAADLTTARVSADGPVSLIPSSQEPAVTGHTAATALPAGSLLTTGDIGPAPPPAGQAMLGVAVEAGQFPPDLAAGDTVDVLATPAGPATGGPAGAGGNAQAALPVGRAIVVSVSPQPATPGTVAVELQVPQDAMPQVAAAAAAGQIDLAAIPATGGQ